MYAQTKARSATIIYHSMCPQHDYEAICQWYEQLASCHPDLVTYVSSIGQTVEGRDTPAVHITATGNKTDTLKIYFQCVIHASK